MNVVNLNSASLNSKRLNVIGDIRSSAGGGGGGGDVPSYPNGVYIQHIDGKLYTADEWTAKGFSNDEANGVAVLTDEAKFVIAKEDSPTGKKMWATDTTNLLSEVTTTTVYADALKDYMGYNNTQKMLVVDKNEAAYNCANYIFPNGNNGYLPSSGEWAIAQINKNAVDALIALIGGRPILKGSTKNYYWTSTQYQPNAAWSFRWDNTVNIVSKDSSLYVRAFTTLSK